jgi:TolB-like protein/Tfp pilus assembly protein PilF
MSDFISELRRRNVFRVAGVYAVVGWLLAQASVLLEQTLGLPGWFDTFVVIVLLLGFPVAMILAWAFEITPEGMRLTSSAAPVQSTAPRTAKKLDYAILVGLVLAVAVIAADRLVPERAAFRAATDASLGAAGADERSIAVLPFTDLSPEGDQGYFADGLSEELLNVLAQSGNLMVAGRTSSFAFKGQNRDLREIAALLNVSHVLEGSVRKSGDRIRVTAQLINASNGYHVFSETYDRNLDDIFAVQDDIAGRIGAALRAELTGQSPAEDGAPTDVAAFDLYLEARQLIYTRDVADMRRAAGLLDEAIAIDPAYAPAHAQKAIVTVLLSDGVGAHGDTPLLVALPAARASAERARALDPTLAEAYAALGLVTDYEGAPSQETEALLRRALALNPNLADARNWLAIVLDADGRLDEGLAVDEEMAASDPFYPPVITNLPLRYANLREFEKAEALIERVERIGGVNGDTEYVRAGVALVRGELASAVERFAASQALSPSNSTAAWYAFALARAGDFERAHDAAPAAFKPMYLQLMGREAEALEGVRALRAPTGGGDYDVVTPALATLSRAGADQELADYVARHFGDVAGAAAGAPYEARAWGPWIAASYRALGRDADLRSAIEAIERAVAFERAAGVDGLDHWHAEAQLAALKGDADGAIAALQSALERGLATAYELREPSYAPLRDDPRFIAIEDEVRARVNVERAKLGLPALQAVR